MADLTLSLRPMSAKVALEKWTKLATDIYPTNQIKFVIATEIGTVKLILNGVTSGSIMEHDDTKRLVGLLSMSVPDLQCVSAEMVDINGPVTQGQGKPTTTFSYQEGPFATITLNNFGNDASSLLRARNLICNQFDIIPRPSLATEGMSLVQAEALKYKERVTSELQVQVEKISRAALEQQAKYDEFFLRIAHEQEEQRKNREEEFAAKERELGEAFQKKSKELELLDHDRAAANDMTRAELARRVAEVDERDNTHVRRALHDKLIAVIDGQKHATLSKDTIAKRAPVAWACFAAALAGLSLVIAFGYVAVKDAEPRWHHMIPLSASFALLVSTIVYYMKWNDQWFREHASAEFRSKKAASDIVRASWLAELVFELKEKDRQLPDQLISRFSEGLFLDAPGGTTEHPTDQFIDLLKKVSTIKVGKDSVELTKEAAKEK